MRSSLYGPRGRHAPTPVGDGVWRLPVLVERNTPPVVNVYALACADRVVLVDAGWDEVSLRTLRSGLAALGAGLDAVEGVLLTHAHPDHAGLAQALQQQTGCWVAAHRAEWGAFEDGGSGENRGGARPLGMLDRLGAPASTAQALEAKFGGIPLLPRPVLTPLDDGQAAPTRGRRIQAVRTPGHSPGHLCFLDETGALFAGDHLLPGLRPRLYLDGDTPRQGADDEGADEEGPDPVGDYLASLDRTQPLSGSLLPGHGEPVADAAALHERARAHYTGRGEQILAALPTDRPVSAWKVADRVRQTERPGSHHSQAAHYLAAVEAYAFLRHWQRLGRVEMRETVGEPPRWRVAPGAPHRTGALQQA
ncbi:MULTISPECIES: MBL fold metallo-hydrolase [Streptacidiphilus]|uniref:MBL fold metallo-hydrolase n=1 Tax=Streptacidiphilus cavernicola TaxID=3342716 RepID=A0ABV6UPK7_9ACTN|nr:MBL fold metallo-hydrolase [Streptacidiphilus jeojiense]